MMMPCESAVKLFLPAVRAGVTKELYRKYGYNQVDIAKKLGITQAAVSKYVAGRYSPRIKNLEARKDLSEAVKRIAQSISESRNAKMMVESTCFLCREYAGTKCKSPIHGLGGQQ